MKVVDQKYMDEKRSAPYMRYVDDFESRIFDVVLAKRCEMEYGNFPNSLPYCRQFQ